MRVDGGDLLDYALGTIDPEGARAVESFLEERPELAAGLRQSQDALAELVMRLPPMPVTEEDEERVLALARQEEGRVMRAGEPERRGGPLWVALGLAIALGLTAWLVFLRFGGGEPSQPDLPGGPPEVVRDIEGRRAGVIIRLADGSLFLAFDEEAAAGGPLRLWAVDGRRVEPLGVTDGRAVVLPEFPEGARLRVTRNGGGLEEEAWLELRP